MHKHKRKATHAPAAPGAKETNKLLLWLIVAGVLVAIGLLALQASIT